MKSKSVMLLSFLIVLLFGSQIVSANQDFDVIIYRYLFQTEYQWIQF
jgi:hypothetical protein